jgi:hypothetical protein
VCENLTVLTLHRTGLFNFNGSDTFVAIFHYGLNLHSSND